MSFPYERVYGVVRQIARQMNRVCERNCAATKGNRLPQRESQTAGVADSTRERANCVWKNLSGGSATIKLHQTPASRSESGRRRGGQKKAKKRLHKRQGTLYKC